MGAGFAAAPTIEPPEAAALLDALLNPNWMVRRKDSVEFGTESLLRRTHSFDFALPPTLITLGERGTRAHATIPLGFWWKAPGKYTNIDFVDEADNSLPLSTSAHDESVTLAVIEEYARRILARPQYDIHFDTLQGLGNIVQQSAITARNEVKNTWLVWRNRPMPTSAAQSEYEVAVLARHDGFATLLEVCAMASIFTVSLNEKLDERRIIKLRYEETCTGLRGTDTFEEPRSRTDRVLEKLRSVALPMGLDSYRIDIGNAFVRGRRYHFEEDAPPGLRLTGVSLKRAIEGDSVQAEHSEPRVHLYERNLVTDTYLTVRGRLVVTDEWLSLALVCTAVAIAVLVAIVNNLESLDPTSSQSVITLAVLVPSIATSIVWRRVHWLVGRLQGGLRLLFGFLGLLLFYIALRIAASPTETLPTKHPSKSGETISRLVDASQIVLIAKLAILWGFLVALLLSVAQVKSTMARRNGRGKR